MRTDNPHTMRRRIRQSGQAAVETAIVMPLFVFTVLGIVQLSLMHQARLLTKYAAYKAARSGALNRGEKEVMANAAIAVMVPMLTRESPISAGSGDVQPQYGLYRANSASDFSTAFKEVAQSRNNTDEGHPIVELTVCHPKSRDIDATKDFDDPQVNPLGGNNDWRPFEKTKLAVQVTTYFKLIIPYANAFLWWASYGKLSAEQTGTMKMLRMKHEGPKSLNQTRKTFQNNPPYTLEELKAQADKGNYIMPIRASYSMRMQSNFSQKAQGELPSSNLCHIPFDTESRN